jgi:hypothetical protein
VNLRATIGLTALLALLVAAALIARRPGDADRPRGREAVFPGLAAGQVQAIQVGGGSGAPLLVRDGATWRVGEKREPADGAGVERLLEELAALRVTAVVSTNAARQAAYEADGEKGVAVRLEGAGGADLASFFVGRSGPDGASSYLRRAGSPDVLLVPGDLRLEFSRTAEDWRLPAGAAAGAAPPAPPAPGGEPR